MFTLDRSAAAPLFRQLSDALRRDIEQGKLGIGSRVPSVRLMAQQCGISLITVVNAYNRLVAEGYLQPRRASGYYVSQPSRSMPPPAFQASMAGVAVDSEWLVSHVFADASSLLMPGCGWLPEGWLEGEQIRHALSTLARKSAGSMVRYGNPYGYQPLRKALQVALHARAIELDPEQIILTQGASQALNLCARLFLKPGDTVLVDDPMYANLIALLRTGGYRVIGVPRTLNGPDCAQLELLAASHRPRAFFTNTSLQNPTGTSTSIASAHRILRAAENFDFRIVEDDIFADLQPQQGISLAALDQLNRVTYIGSLSKSISPSLRVGFIAAGSQLARELAQKKMLEGLTSCEISEKLASIILTEGRHRLSIERLRGRCEQAQRSVAAGLENCGLQLFHRPSAGMFLWARFAAGIDTVQVAQQAADQALLLAPGKLFETGDAPSPWLRFNVAHSDHAQVYRFLERIAAGKA
ncbi:PLP-dependent aminotransferase family protein [Herminiimonas sp. CN]|uniref:aminotransferase-like domain-containing protein n=1 Tax=Herminiimonas sp. CN TaxID=1349818 RepID=UPI000473545F|nr:PLP-dependent aminotransferase family protein [Herminiimonas sp. CN]